MESDCKKNEPISVDGVRYLSAMVNHQLWVMNPSVCQLETYSPPFFQPGGAPMYVTKTTQKICLLKEVPHSFIQLRTTIKNLENFRLFYNKKETLSTVGKEAFCLGTVDPSSSDSLKAPLFNEKPHLSNTTQLVYLNPKSISNQFTMSTSVRPSAGGVDPITTPVKSLEKWKDSLHHVTPNQDVIMTDVQEAAAHILHGPTAPFLNDSKGYSTEYSQTDRSRIFFDEYGNETVEATRDEFLNNEINQKSKQKKTKTKKNHLMYFMILSARMYCSKKPRTTMMVPVTMRRTH